MSSRFPNNKLCQAGTALLGAFMLTACNEDRQRPQDAATPAAGPQYGAVSTLFPGDGKAQPPDPTGLKYINDPHAIAEGKRLFGWYNCSGCHFHGGGGIGPALMDKSWIYGGDMDQIFESIYQGRPNGMPVWGKKLPNNEIWELAAYVHSMAAEAANISMPTEPPPAVPGSGLMSNVSSGFAAPAKQF